MNIEFPEDSDTSDEDYVPSGPGKGGEVPSEVESDGDPEDPLSDSDEVNKKGTKRKKRTNKTKKKAKTDSQESSTESSPVKPQQTDEDKKKRADLLWADFKKDTGFKKRTENTPPEPDTKEPVVTKSVASTVRREPEKVKVTQVFEFAGEEVKIEKEVPKDSAEARLTVQPSGSSPASNRGRGKGGLGGIGSVLSQIGKKQKLSTLEKSKLDWNMFKKSEDIEEELDRYKKGKDGYLERQDFLERADLRRFEIEKELRTIERNKRMNNVPQ